MRKLNKDAARVNININNSKSNEILNLTLFEDKNLFSRIKEAIIANWGENSDIKLIKIGDNYHINNSEFEKVSF